MSARKRELSDDQQFVEVTGHSGARPCPTPRRCVETRLVGHPALGRTLPPDCHGDPTRSLPTFDASAVHDTDLTPHRRTRTHSRRGHHRMKPTPDSVDQARNRSAWSICGTTHQHRGHHVRTCTTRTRSIRDPSKAPPDLAKISNPIRSINFTATNKPAWLLCAAHRRKPPHTGQYRADTPLTRSASKLWTNSYIVQLLSQIRGTCGRLSTPGPPTCPSVVQARQRATAGTT